MIAWRALPEDGGEITVDMGRSTLPTEVPPYF